MRRAVDIRKLAAPAPLVELALVKSHCNVEHDDDDALLSLQMDAVSEMLDGPNAQFGRAMGGGEYAFSYDGCGRCTLGAVGRITSLSGVDGAIVPAYVYGAGTFSASESWLTDGRFEVQATFDVDVPSQAKALALMMIGQMYAHREEVIGQRIWGNPQIKRLLTDLSTRWVA